MQNHDKTIQDAMAIAQSPDGQKLLQTLRSKGGKPLEQALQTASVGDYTQIKQLLTSLMSDPDTKKLLDQLGGDHGRKA